MNIDLSPWRVPADLIDAIWTARRADRRDLQPEIVGLLRHEDPNVREEAISLLFVKWADTSQRELLVNLVHSDPDFGVRARAAGAFAVVSNESTRQRDCEVLRAIVLDRGDDPTVRKASYEAIHHILRGAPLSLDDDIDLDEDVDLDWLKQI